MLPLIGVLVVVIGFAVRLNPLLVVAAAALVTGLAGGLAPLTVLAAFGKAFNDNRFVSLVWLVLPVIGLLEAHGLQDRARERIGRLRKVAAGRLLLVYLVLRQLTSALGLTALGGHPQMVRPLVAPMAEAAAQARAPGTSEQERQRVRAFAAATDNVGLFFGEDVFIAIGSILLIRGFLQQSGVEVDPLRLSLWAMPTAFAALAIHGARLLLLDRRLARAAAAAEVEAEPPPP